MTIETPAPPKSDLAVRTGSAVIMLVVVALALWSGGWFFAALIGIVGMAGAIEWSAMARRIWGSVPSRLVAILFGAAYILFACINLYHFRLIGVAHALLPIAVTIATDIGAYFIGRKFGGPKIAPSISPSKTWSGLVGGMGAAAVVTLAWAYYFAYHRSLPIGPAVVSVLAGAALAVVAQAGDFLESSMKRRAGLKDSGNLIPGHGGVLDRIDGMLAVSIACFLIWLAMFAMID